MNPRYGLNYKCTAQTLTAEFTTISAANRNRRVFYIENTDTTNPIEIYLDTASTAGLTIAAGAILSLNPAPIGAIKIRRPVAANLTINFWEA